MYNRILITYCLLVYTVFLNASLKDSLTISSFQEFPQSDMSGFITVPASVKKSGCPFSDSIVFINLLLNSGRTDIDCIDYELRILRNILSDLERKKLTNPEKNKVRRLEKHLTCIHYNLSSIYKDDISTLQRELQLIYYYRKNKRGCKRKSLESNLVIGSCDNKRYCAKKNEFTAMTNKKNDTSGLVCLKLASCANDLKLLRYESKEIPLIYTTSLGIGWSRFFI